MENIFINVTCMHTHAYSLFSKKNIIANETLIQIRHKAKLTRLLADSINHP
jgi:hypothetical protein